MKDKVKVGLLIDRDVLDLWKYRIIRRIADSGSGEIDLVIRNSQNLNETETKRYSLFYRWYERFDRYFFRNKIDFDRETDISELIANTPQIKLDDYSAGHNDYINKDLSSELLKFRIDLIMCLGKIPDWRNYQGITEYGLWYYDIGDKRVIRGGPPGYWEIVKNYSEIGAAVRMIDNNGEDSVIYRTWVSTYPSSVNVTRDQILGFASVLIPRLIKDIYVKGPDYLNKLKQKFNVPIEINNVRLYKNPSNFGVIKNLFFIFKKYFIRKIVNLNPDPWFLIYKLDNDLLSKRDTNGFKELKGPSGTFWADPFVYNLNNRHYFFVEEYIYKTDKGHISVLELDEKGTFQSCTKIIERAYHMSYPFVFEFNKTYYLVPETSDNKTIQLYRSTKFPYEWEFVCNLIENVSAVDTTLFYHEDKWWLFTSIDMTQTRTVQFNELFLFYSDDLLSGNWQSHPGNPIVTDLKSSRSAGKIFCDGGKIYRPSQDCSGRYGYALNLNQITELNEEKYQEVLIAKIEPALNKKFLGIHTLNFDTNITVLDVSTHLKRVNFDLIKKPDLSITTPFKIVKGDEQRKIKILFFIDGLTSGGKERRLTELMKGLKLLPEIDFELVLMNKSIHYMEVFDLGIKIHYVIRQTKKDISVFKEFYEICRTFRPDIVHCWDSMTAVYLIPACKLLKIKIINGMVVDTPVQQNVLNKNWFRARITFPFADTIVGNSNAGLAAYRAPAKNALCIYNGMDLARFENLADKSLLRREFFGTDSDDIFIVGMVAAFQPRKDYMTLINSAIRLISEIKGMRFILVGSGVYFEEVRDMVPPQFSNKIVLTGGRSDVESIVNIFDVGILLTNTKLHGEGISNSIIEYMALQKPVIANRGGGTDEVVVDNYNGFLIDSENEDQLIGKILFLYNNKKVIDEFGRNGRRLIEEKFDIKIMTRHYIDLYNKLTI